ncbi:ABC transporter ATP-binding protein [Mesonia sp. HuA40]|uniref:ABC transporter ATP-binding protein n=1 Tax=Mesonia sp. HuA40 TaxID=2602761 RepID=UPI0011CAFE05|nr:ABC transporter ATP-binding protein [Mesonia sp. HuA40]TXK72665.1 ABC transporter ATP-binding protein [Mesonia sp. HuA40]
MLQIHQISYLHQSNLGIQNISFNLQSSRHLAIIGPSGCGKSTLLKCIYGLFDLQQGSIHFKAERVLGPAYNLVPGHPQMKYLAQYDNVMPYTSVSENIKEHLSRQHPEENERRCVELLRVIGLEEFAHTQVKNLSGGQRQRVALAQVLAKAPQLLLLDEPFNFIDNFKKNTLRRSIFNYLKKENIACIFATHDRDDMLAFADEVLVLEKGKTIAQGNPKALFENPRSKAVAALFYEVNELPASWFNDAFKGTFLVYPFELKWHRQKQKNGVAVQIEQSLYQGTHFLNQARHQDEIIFFETPNQLQTGEKGWLELKDDLLESRLI